MLPQNIRKYFKKMGQKGGKERAKKLSPSALSSQAQKAVVSRWMRKRFGTNKFEELGLPGWEVIDSGLQDLINGNFSTIHALAVAELRPRLRFLGVPVPGVSHQISNSRILLYQAIEKKHGDMAHARFCSLLERVDSFCHSLASLFPVPQLKTHRQRRWYA